MTSSERSGGVLFWIRRWAREPLLHFILIGTALFLGLQALSPRVDNSSAADEIIFSEDDLSRLAAAWQAQRGSPPTQQELAALVDEQVREEVLSREAVGLGLDRGDPIIRRRLAQKMDFLAADIAALQDPSDSELRTWYTANSANFAEPARASFRHLYFSFDRGSRARGDAATALQEISAQRNDAAKASADPFMFRDYYSERTSEQMAREFGADFANTLFQLKPGSWNGPIRSGYGWHLVYVDSLIPSRIPPYEEVAPEVKKAWLENQQRVLRDRAYETMRARHKVVLPGNSQVLPATQSDAVNIQ